MEIRLDSDAREREEALEHILAYYEKLEDSSRQDHVVTMLREIQEIYGCIPDDIQKRAALAAGVKPAVITCIMNLYKSLKSAPYRHRITVCVGPSCYEKERGLLEAVKKKLDIGADGFSADKRIFLETRSCVKQCRTAPNLMIDGILFSNIKKENLDELFSKALN